MAESHGTGFWVDRLRQGDDAAAQKLWELFFQRLVALAQKRLASTRIAIADQEDVALSAFNSFCIQIENGRYPDINDRENLWRLLATITRNKVHHLIRDQARKKRGGDWKKLSENASNAGQKLLLNELVCHEPTPQLAAEFAEQCARLLAKLPSQELIELAVKKMEGYTNEEIATQYDKSERTIERKLHLIRKIWLSSSIDLTSP